METYDSTPETLAHIHRVQELLNQICENLKLRAEIHDDSKLRSPEKEGFDEFTPKLKDSTYGSEEYKGFLADMSIFLSHHYKHNSHHPEFWPNRESESVNEIDVLLEKIDFLKSCDLEVSEEAREEIEEGEELVNFDLNDLLNPISDILKKLAEDNRSKVSNMSLLDILEMFVDWKAATERHSDGSLEKSIQINSDRFKISEQLTSVFENTRKELEWK